MSVRVLTAPGGPMAKLKRDPLGGAMEFVSH